MPPGPASPHVLASHAYGKTQVRLTTLDRRAGCHEFRDLCVAVELRGAFEAAYLAADNACVVPTDTMKNVVYVMASQAHLGAPEHFAGLVGEHFVCRHPQVHAASVRIDERRWHRVRTDRGDHPHAFCGADPQRHCLVTVTREGRRVEAGIEGLPLLKTTDSAFLGFARDEYTTLAETEDRILETSLGARWRYGTVEGDWDGHYALVRTALVETFANHKSASLQHSLFAMGSAALDACRDVDEIDLVLPNVHHWAADLSAFGLENCNRVFVRSEAPTGVIKGTLRRR